MKRLIPLLLILTAGCSAGPEPIRWGTDACDTCRMVLSDKQFGAELVETGGQVRKFDGLDELLTFTSQSGRTGKIYVTNGQDGSLVPVEKAVIVRSPGINSPMGGEITTFDSKYAAEDWVKDQKLGQVTYPTLEELQKQGGAGHASH
jgi:copper chaperone NosL